jgi:hypothetical protein
MCSILKNLNMNTKSVKVRSEVVKQRQKEYFAKNKERFREMNNASARECMRGKYAFRNLCKIYTELYEPEDKSNYIERRGRPRKNIISLIPPFRGGMCGVNE